MMTETHLAAWNCAGQSMYLVAEDGAKVADDVDDAKHKAALAEHGYIGAPFVVGDGGCCGFDDQMVPNLRMFNCAQQIFRFASGAMSGPVVTHRLCSYCTDAHVEQVQWCRGVSKGSMSPCWGSQGRIHPRTL